jgi:oxygen-dependent protoporphyrinogen oxidase
MRRVAIIGGGLAGLTCAYALKQRGVEAVVFDASAMPGGRLWTEHKDGFIIDAGAQYLLSPDLFRNTFRLIRDLGLSGNLLPIAPHVGQVYQGRIYRYPVASAIGLLKFKGLNIADKALLPRMAYLLARYSPHLDFHHPEHGLDFDDETVASFVKREFSQNVLNYVAGPLISTLFFYGSEETSKLLYLLLARHMFNTRMSTLRGGIGRITATLSQEASIVAGSPVETIVADGAAYVIEGQRFANVVVAAPGDAVPRIAGMNELLSEPDRAFFRNCRYQHVLTLAVGTERPVDGKCYGVSIPRVENFTAAAMSFHDYMDPARVPEGCGLLAITGGGENVSADRMLEDLQRLYNVEPRFTKAYEWRSGTPKFPPGRYREIAAFRKRVRRPGLFFCGDYLMGPFVEAAITTGLEAADAIK